MVAPLDTARGAWIETSDCDLDDFRALMSVRTKVVDYPLASAVRHGLPVYSPEIMQGADRRTLQTELIRALADARLVEGNAPARSTPF